MNNDFLLSSYDYYLPQQCIAQTPSDQRDRSRLLVVQTINTELIHTRFDAILEYLRPGDLLVLNNTRVFPARFLGKKETGGKVEMLLLEYPNGKRIQENGDNWYAAETKALIKSSKRPKQGATLIFSKDIRAEIQEIQDDGKVLIAFHYRLNGAESLDDLLNRKGQIPLPPYIQRPEGSTNLDTLRYQTCYARATGSVAAPTAGLHFSDTLLKNIAQKGIDSCSVTLHVGYGTFAPVRKENIREHRLHKEYIEVSSETADKINQAKQRNGRIWAVGTTTVRTLEFAASQNGRVQQTNGPCGLFIYPGFKFQIVDNLITNFHLPQSSLLFLVSALVGRERLLSCYKEAVSQRYRFFSYGDAMAIIGRK